MHFIYYPSDILKEAKPMQYATRHLNFSFIYGFLNSSTEFLEKYEKPKIDAQLYILLYTDF